MAIQRELGILPKWRTRIGVADRSDTGFDGSFVVQALLDTGQTPRITHDLLRSLGNTSAHVRIPSDVNSLFLPTD